MTTKKINPTVGQKSKKATAGIPSTASALDLPILSALVEEILHLKAGKLSDTHIQITKPQLFNAATGKKKEVVQKRHAKPSQEPHAEVPTERPMVSARKAHAVCNYGVPEVPKNKSWLRQAPSIQSYAVNKTKLTPGLTNTQRLRLAKTNPQLLETLEQQERERLEKRKPQLMKKSTTKEQEIKEAQFMGTDTNLSSEASILKRPIPTPRQSKTKISIDYGDPKSDSFEAPHPVMDQSPASAVEEPKAALMQTHTIIPRPQSANSDASVSIQEGSKKSESDSEALFMSSLDMRRVTESYYDDVESQASSQVKLSSANVPPSKTPQPETTATSDFLDNSNSLKYPLYTSESISSYVPTDEEKPADRVGDYSDEFEDLSEEYQMPLPKSMKELEIDPLAKIGSTWHAK
jgi:hypothetical protein